MVREAESFALFTLNSYPKLIYWIPKRYTMSKRSKNAEAWSQAKRKFRLSDAHIQMARELGMNPKKFGSLANHKQEPWKAPLPDFIESLYRKRFRKETRNTVLQGRSLSPKSK